MKAYIINGPNLNLLGKREPEIYGTTTLKEIVNMLHNKAQQHGIIINCMQSNHEGKIIDWIQEATINNIDVIIINAGAYSHSSIAIYDALKSFSGYTIELHISNPHLREPFRHKSYIAMAADAIVTGLGIDSYVYILDILPTLLQKNNQHKNIH